MFFKHKFSTPPSNPTGAYNLHLGLFRTTCMGEGEGIISLFKFATHIK